MPIQVTVILDSGCFLPQVEGNNDAYTEIGYFQSSKSVSDIWVIADGHPVTGAERMDLGKKSRIEVRHVKADGSLNKGGVTHSNTFNDELLQLEDLYGEGMPVDRAKFDCILHFDSGHFCGALLKPRRFKEYRLQADGKYVHTPDAGVKMIDKPIAHNVHVHFKLKMGEALELARDGVVFWSSKDTGAKDYLVIEFIADNTTAEKFYRVALKGKRDSYWGSQGDPPPMQGRRGETVEDYRLSIRRAAWTSGEERAARSSPPQKYITMPVFYGTTRQKTRSKAPNSYYGHKRGDFEYGVCEVSIPENHEIGAVERPSLWRFEFRENPEKHIVLLEIEPMQETDFFSSLSTAITKSKEKSALVFVHGFNVTFAEAARRTAQLAVDLEFHGAPIFYSWPSKGKLSLAGYRHDANNIDWSALHLEKFLADIAARLKVKALHLIAHSMGNQALTQALAAVALNMKARARAAFNEVVLTAPDIDAEVFKQVAQTFKKAARRITLYASSHDKALIFSKKYQGDYPRAGDSGDGIVVVPGVDSIDASEVDTNLVGHFYYGDNDSILSDLYYLLNDGKPPDNRFGLVPKMCSNGKYWVFKPKKK